MSSLLTGLSPTIAVIGAVVMGVFGLLALAGTGFLAVRLVRSRKGVKPTTGVLPGLLGSASAAAQSPLVKEFEKVIVQALHNSQYALLNAAVAKMFPTLAPYVTGPIDQLADGVLGKITGLPLSPAPAPTPTAPTLPAQPIFFPPGHPVLDLLHKVLQAYQDKINNKPASGAGSAL